MIFIWGKRTYGAVSKVNDISVKTVFGHLWYLPLFPMGSYYVNNTTDGAYELKQLDLRSVLAAYVRVWGPILFLVFLMMFQGDETLGTKVLAGFLMLASAAGVAGTYLYDKKKPKVEEGKIRQMMHWHFGVAIDPHACLDNMQGAIEERMRETSTTLLDATWYKRIMNDMFSPKQTVELALLRARCDQGDKPLQEAVMKKLADAPAKT